MCKFCEEKQPLLFKEVPVEVWGTISGYEEMQIIIDRGYLRLGFTGDMQCMDNGEKIKIKYCPFCCEELTHEFLKI